MKKRIVVMLAALALLAGAASVFAESGTVAVSGGSLAETITAGQPRRRHVGRHGPDDG